MKQKTLLFIAVAALAALASCSQDEITGINNGNAIDFRASVGKSTRAATHPNWAHNVTSLENMGSFNVTAISTKNDNSGKELYFSDNYTSVDAGNTWTSPYVRYWPNDKPVDFYAYSPEDLGATIDATTQQIVDFTPNKDVAQQKDVVIAYNNGTKSVNEGPGVDMNFKHALAQIEVRAKCPGNSSIQVEAAGYKIGHIPSTSTFTFPTVITGGDFSLDGKWSTPETPVSYYVLEKKTAPVVLGDAATPLMFGEYNAMLIPQELTSWSGGEQPDGAYLSVYCRILNVVKPGVAGSPTIQLFPVKDGEFGYAAVPIPANTKWLPGYKYIYTLEFKGGGQIDPEDPDPDDPGKKTGEPILGGPIKLNIDVMEWADEPADIPMGPVNP